MCINFFWQSDQCEQDSYSFILVNNRDEFWDKPTKGAHFWGPNNSCISATGRQGGTWLGMNKNGKVATLVNVLGENDRNKIGRGFLVSDYISSDINILDYAMAVETEKEKIRGFNLLLFDLSVMNNKREFHQPMYISNATLYPNSNHFIVLPKNEYFGISNSIMELPFKKVEQGKLMFHEIVTEYPSLSQKDYLIKDLFQLLSDSTHFKPDTILEKACARVGSSQEAINAYSAINTFSFKERLGTRTSTVILVDSSGKVDYVEKNYDFSSNPEHPDFSICHQSFSLVQH